MTAPRTSSAAAPGRAARRETVAAVALPLLAISMAILVWRTHGYASTSKYYRISIETWLEAARTASCRPRSAGWLSRHLPAVPAMLLAPFAFLP